MEEFLKESSYKFKGIPEKILLTNTFDESLWIFLKEILGENTGELLNFWLTEGIAERFSDGIRGWFSERFSGRLSGRINGRMSEDPNRRILRNVPELSSKGISKRNSGGISEIKNHEGILKFPNIGKVFKEIYGFLRHFWKNFRRNLLTNLWRNPWQNFLKRQSKTSWCNGFQNKCCVIFL